MRSISDEVALRNKCPSVNANMLTLVTKGG